MSWIKKLLGNSKKNQDTHVSGTPIFLRPQYDVPFQMEMAKVIGAEKVPAGMLLWISLPFSKNTLYDPCFGVYVDPATYGKLNRANAFQLEFGKGSANSTFQWVVRVQDPDNPPRSLEFTSEQILLDDLALVKLRHFLESMEVFYLYYVSATQSNFVYLSIPVSLKQQIPSLYPELQAKSSPPPATQGSRAASSTEGLEVTNAYIKCPDGTIINLTDIREVSAPRLLIGIDPNLFPGGVRSEQVAGAVLLIRYFPGGTGDRPIDKLVPVEDFDRADELVTEIQKARKMHKAGAEPEQGRIVLGECENCHRPLRVKAHAVTRNMRLTCKCGHMNTIHVPDTLLKS